MKQLSRLLLIILVLTSSFVFAQKKESDLIPKDEKAGKILEELSAKNRAYSAIHVDFSYRLFNKDEEIDETQKGEVTLKGKKYILKIAGQQIISNGSTIWTYIEDADEVQVDNAPEEGDDGNLMNPANLFTMYEKGFKYVYDKESVEEGKAVHVIKLFPIEAEEKMYHTIVMYVLKTPAQVHKVVVKGKDGNEYTYFMDTFKGNYNVEDAMFDFDVTKVSDVIDLRD